MGFDAIYNLAIWADKVARKYGVTTTKVVDLFKAMKKYHTEDETKEMIEIGLSEGRKEWP